MRNDYQLRRWLMKEVHGVDIARKPARKASVLHRGPARDWKYRAWIRTLPCASCGATHDIEAAHTGSDGGMALKASDYSCIPLCTNCHTMAPDSHHRDRREFERRLDVAELVRRLNRLWFHPLRKVIG